ncbi:guanine nucleotide-exchange factor SEC12 [Procambarus clarkii]|uniref:guanine nucleotide-exchange factor SEC12 n=1 Tax=Procambarus clarkii TaxID=6728 RepID=UPI001E671079|nr:prolactin regulatory element-binding protein-like [Procambarus clarkii]
MAGQKGCETVASVTFPSYCVTAVSGRHVVVGGGGGAAKTGIRNQFDVYELYHNGTQTVGERVLSYDVGNHCITNMVAWPGAITAVSSRMMAPAISLAMGLEESCVLLKLKPLLQTVKKDEILSQVPKAKEKGHSGLRRRRTSERSAEEGSTEKEEIREEKRRKKSLNTTLRGNKYFSFDVEKVNSAETVVKKNSENESYQKCCGISSDYKFLVTGGTDGYLRFWSLPDMKKIKEIKAHEKEVDDINIKPDGKELVSVCKPTRECCVWNVKDGKKFTQVALQTNGVKYKCFRARYGSVESNPNKTRLFTISNPVVGTKNPAIVAKWCGRTYTQERTQNLPGSLSSLSLSDDGRFLATGTMSGTIYILIAFSLQQLRTIEDAHSMFITGLEWLPTENKESQMVRGFSDASVLSISCDNSLKIYHIPRQGMVPVWVVAILAAVILCCAFLLANFLGL